MIRIHGQPAGHGTLIEVLADRAARAPQRFALEIAGTPLTLGEWEARSSAVAANLHRLGVRKGDRVATLLHNHVAQVLIWFGAAKIGAIWCPFNVALVGEDLRYTLLDSGPRVLVVDAETAPAVAALNEPTLVQMHRFTVDEPSADTGLLPFGELLASGAARPDVLVAPSDPAVIIYTGGTTGMPKGVVLPHFAYVAGGFRYCEFWEPHSGDVHYTALQLFHAGCQHGAVLAPLFGGIPAYIDRWFSARAFWRRVRETRATLIDPLGTMLAVLCKQPPDLLDRVHEVRCCWFATAHLPKSILEEFQKRFGVRLRPGSYALSESGGNYTISQRLHDPEHPEGACGKPWGWAEVCIADELDQPLQPGEVGEILLRPTIPYTFMLHYHNKPEVTSRALRNQWLHTGDYGWVDPRGYLFFKGRQAHWLRRRGENISAFEVESIVAQYPGVAEVAVLGVPSELGEEDVKAFVIPSLEHCIDPAQLWRWCVERMTRFKVPRFIEIVDDFPRSAAKREVQREKLRALGNANAWDSEAPGNTRRSTERLERT